MPSARGTYEPPDDIHVFDGSEEDDDVEGSRLPLLIVIALFVLAAFGGVVWMAYTQGVQRGRVEAPKTIVAQNGPAKVAPTEDQAGGTPYKGLKIFQQPAPADEASDHQSAPPPTNPDVNTQAPSEPETGVVTPQSSAPAETPPAQTATADKEPPLAVAKSITPPKTVTPPPPKATPAPQKVAAAPKVTPPLATTQATSAPAQLGTKVATDTAPAPATHTAPAAGGAYVLQIGAYKSEAEADAAWKTYSGKHSGTLGGYSKDVKQVDLGAKGTWYRLRVGSFADKNAAAALCAKLTAEGGACFPAK
ncbi:MAG TPA: SPOR domain-containing protein [Rhizomicrobium sp.]|nr:SPOR domain-containing protein [Rhizomicrobium sp.]